MPYKYRNLDCINKSWYIGGSSSITTENSSIETSGILEWCRSFEDARNMLDKMNKFSEFSDLTIGNLFIESTEFQEYLDYMDVCFMSNTFLDLLEANDRTY